MRKPFSKEKTMEILVKGGEIDVTKIPEHLITKEIAIKMVASNGINLKSLSQSQRTDLDICEVAVTNNPEAIEFVDKSLLKSPEIWRALFEQADEAQGVKALGYMQANLGGEASCEMLKDKTIALNIVKNAPLKYELLPMEMKKDIDVARTVLEKKPNLYQYMPIEVRLHPSAMILAFRNDFIADICCNLIPQNIKNHPMVSGAVFYAFSKTLDNDVSLSEPEKDVKWAKFCYKNEPNGLSIEELSNLMKLAGAYNSDVLQSHLVDIYCEQNDRSPEEWIEEANEVANEEFAQFEYLDDDFVL